MSGLSLVRPSVVIAALAVSVAVAACGGGGVRRDPPAGGATATMAASGSLAVVLSACESDGATALLPGSDGLDAGAVPDDTPAVCGCWVRWMDGHLAPRDRAAVVIGVTLSASVMSVTDVALVDRLRAVLGRCEPGPAPGRSASHGPAPPMSSPGA